MIILLSGMKNGLAIDLRRKSNATSPTGIYRCDVSTKAVLKVSVYVGLYATTGGYKLLIIILMLYYTNLNIGSVTVASEGIRLTVNLTRMNPQFILTCISIGGPATSLPLPLGPETPPLSLKEMETVLDYPVTAQYTHTLTVTERGNYTCQVVNIISNDSATHECKNLSNTINFVLLF